MDYFKKLVNLLKMERESDKEAYLKQTANSSVTERRAAGLVWYPISIAGTEPSRGDYLTVSVERPSHQEISHQLRFGAQTVLFSNHNAQIDRVEGIISYQYNNQLKINIYTDELPEWCKNGKLGIELLFDDNTYNDMFATLKTADTLYKDSKEGNIVKVLTGINAPSFNKILTPQIIDGLNNIQQAAVNKILSANELAIIHGPPGTGKTTTLVKAIGQIAVNEQVLVVAPSNAAVDLLSEKLSEEGLRVLRIGNPVRISNSLTELTLDYQTSVHPYMKECKKLKKQASEYKNLAHKYKRSFGKAERDQRKALFDEAHKIMKEVAKAEEFVVNDLVEKAQVITATLAGANHYTIQNLKFNTVFIDEAGQALEPACWIPILKAPKVVLAGDHCQLPPTIKSKEAGGLGLENTLLQKCVLLYPEAVTMLNMQYRMNSVIMEYPSKIFYNSALNAHNSVANKLLFEGDSPLTFIDTAGSGYHEKLEGTSSTNPDEAVFLINYLIKLVEKIKSSYSKLDFPSIAIISPYREQIRLLKEQLLNSTILNEFDQYIGVNTIDSFQGQERDLVLISLVRSNANGEIGFLADIRRMNVAITRARKKVVLIGDSATIGKLPFYEGLINYAESVEGYKSVWEFLE